jgi:hypothetical protein
MECTLAAETLLAGQPVKNPPAAWKLIVAAEAPWVGEVYHSRPGHSRQRFTTPETFCTAVLGVTDWSLTPASTRGSTSSGTGRHHRPRSIPLSQTPSTTGKFIVAADVPWGGEIYRTRPGLGRFRFSTFEEFLRAVLSITAWPIDSAASAGHRATG